jgi:glutamate formiminotransferase / formiminotetrahydrofolate cyclodeaminase
MKRLMECVPNFSEGRDASKVDALVAEMCSVPGVWLLDRESDADHNRSVITLAGEPEAVAEAALRGVGQAAALIDLTRHTGAHPRIGAADVVPFVPIEGCTLDDCVAVARRVGREIWERYRIPVYFYEAAATRPDRANLENVRKGQFEGLREDVLRDPDRAPDIGEPRLHATAGAVAVGARKFLIAYNINLNTNDVGIAKKIAKAIRFSSGGLRYVKAMGVGLKARNLAQVSVNLTDFEQTPLHRVFEMVKCEAERNGCAIAGSEIVGLIPRKAIELTAEFYLQVENFSPALVLENRVAAAEQGLPASASGREKLAALAKPFLEAVAEPTATPGGGSVSALAGALAASLGEMVAGLSRKKKSQEAFHEILAASIAAMREAAGRLTACIDRDAEAFQAVMAAQKLPRETPGDRARRDAEIERATRRATEVPLETALAAADVFERLVQLEVASATSMISDLRVARLMAAVAARGALENVAINLAGLHDPAYISEMKSRAASVEARLAASPVTAGD